MNPLNQPMVWLMLVFPRQNALISMAYLHMFTSLTGLRLERRVQSSKWGHQSATR
jgi:hypothetical protein